LPEALARVRHDSVLSGSAREKTRNRAPFMKGRLRALLPAGARGYAGAAMAAVMVGIVVNALSLQHERHPSPFFSAGVVGPVAAAKPLASTATASLVAPAEPPARPSDLGVATEPSQSPHAGDPIGDILKGGANKDPQHLITAAQTALVKLGYTVKVSGAAGADMTAALRDFEKSHGLLLSSDVSPHLVKLLVAAGNTSASR